VKELVESLNAASQQQTDGVQTIARSVIQIQGVTKGTAANSEESAAAGEQLNAQADSLRGLVTGLTELVDGARSDR
jgi:methyl-accepting chemotaxis protein